MSSSTRLINSSHVLLAGSSDWLQRITELFDRHTSTTIRTTKTISDALEIVHTAPIDCVISAYELEESTGIHLLRSLREDTSSLPIILCTDSGNEEIASEAIGAGATDYIKLPDEVDVADLFTRIEQNFRSTRRRKTQQDRARQFDAIFHDTRTATWVLDSTGSVVRINQTAQEMFDEPVKTLIGESFWTLPWWAQSDGLQADIHQIITTAVNGQLGDAVITCSPDHEKSRILDLSARPVRNEREEIVSIVVEGVDITDRVTLERDLRQSEELHRVTLNNMTDTILITDEEGEYTYVCPNVHFIFGYNSDEIRDMGSISDLLGENLFDRKELASEGVLKNIECTATDKAGYEHTLLVNVREVSIQDGTLLYSCRDVTKRKQREEALATLQETARDFLYAGTHQEIAQHTVDDTPGVLNLDASGVYLFDDNHNELIPSAYSTAMERLNGPLPTINANGDGLISYSFVQDESLFFSDVHTGTRLKNQATDIRSAAYIPLGSHGVFFVGSATVGAFDEITRELVDLLAATAEAALDRVTRESRLRKQERELQQQNDQLTTLNRINETIREIDQALVQAETREGIEHTVCELLTADDRFDFAWIGTIDSPTETVQPRAWAGTEQGYLDSLAFSVEASQGDPTGRTAATREMTMIANVADGLREENWRKSALSRDYLSILSIPLEYDGLSYGVLAVYAGQRDAFDELSREVLVELGKTIASAISTIEQKNALLTTSVTQAEFSINDPVFILSWLARKADCTISYRGGIQQMDDGCYVFLTIENGSIDTVEQVAAESVAIETTQRINTDATGGVLRLQLTQPFLALELANHGAILQSATVEPNIATLVIDIPDSGHLRQIDHFLRETFADVKLRSKQTVDHPSQTDLRSQILEQLTDRQLEVIQTAYYSGFFESPRESTGEEVAATLGISPAAFYQHARIVQYKLFTTLFDSAGVTAAASRVES